MSPEQGHHDDGDGSALGILLDRLSAARPLTEEDARAVLELPVTRCGFELDQNLRHADGRHQDCSVVLNGYAFRHKMVGIGARQILAVCVPGDLIDAETLVIVDTDSDVQALTRIELARIDRQALRDLAADRPAIGQALWHESLVEGAISREWIANIGRRSARGRTAHLMCEVAVRSERAGMGERSDFELPMTQEQLGDALGLTAVHVNRTLRSMQDDGLIRRSKRSVAVADWRGLVAEADFDPAYLYHR